MVQLNLLHNSVCILVTLLILGKCAVIPQSEAGFPETDLVHKWDTVSRIKSKMGPSDGSTRDRLLHEFGKAPKTPPKLYSAPAGTGLQKIDASKKAMIDRYSLKSSTEMDLARLTNPLSVKLTAGHVGYEERHRFSGIPFDQLLDVKGTFAETVSGGVGGTFESDHEDSDAEDMLGQTDDESDGASFDYPGLVFEDPQLIEEYLSSVNKNEVVLEVSNWVASSQSIAMDTPAVNPQDASSQIHWSIPPQSKDSGMKYTEAEEELSDGSDIKQTEEEKLSDATDIKQTEEEVLSFSPDKEAKAPQAEQATENPHSKAPKPKRKSPRKASLAKNRHDQHHANSKDFVLQNKKSEGRQRRENGPIDTITSSHRGTQTS